MNQIKKKSLRDSKSARWFMLVLVSFTMMCMYYLTDAMAPLQERLQAQLGWSASDYGFFTSGYGWFNVFLLMLIFSGMILDKLGVRFTGVLGIAIMLIGAFVKYWAISGHVQGMYELKIFSWQIISESAKSSVVAGLGFAIFGVGCEMFGIAANKAVVRWFRGKEMALAIGLNTSTGRIGTALAMFTPIPLVRLTGDISAPVILSMILLGIGLLVFILNIILLFMGRNETFWAVLKLSPLLGIIGYILSFLATMVLLKFEKKKMKSVFIGIVTMPIFSMSWFILNLVCIFKPVKEWHPIELNIGVTIDDVTKQ
jgi:MFS family permease